MSTERRLVRGRVYAALIIGIDTEKYFVVVSNNRRNAALPSALAVRITSSVKPAIATIIELSMNDPVQGRVLCDDIVEIYGDEVRRDLGALSPTTMQSIGRGLKFALSLE